MLSLMHRSVAAALFAFGFAGTAHGFAAEIVDPGQGAIELPRGTSGAFELSGITYAGANAGGSEEENAGKNRYYAVSDHGGRLFALEIDIDPVSGWITASRVERAAKLATARDTEGIAFDGHSAVWVCDEVGPAVRKHAIEDGSVRQSIAIPPVFARMRHNLSLEALALDPAGALWIGNEEALQVDGPKSSAERGTLVRFQQFVPSTTDPTAWIPGTQWAYETDPIPGDPLGGFARSGVVDFVAIEGGRLLVLERGMGSGGIRSRIYWVDGSRATDTSTFPSLMDAQIATVEKRLLWEGIALGDNFEGMTLGPRLQAGDQSLVLISDDGGVTQPRLYALRFRTANSRLPGRAEEAAGTAGGRNEGLGEGPDEDPAEEADESPTRLSPSARVATGVAVSLLLGAWVLRRRIRR